MAHVLTDLPMSKYAIDDVGAPVPTLNSSTAVRLLDHSALHAWNDHPKLNNEHKPKDPTDAMEFGTAVHSALFENWSVIEWVDADSWRTNAAKAAREDARARGRLPMLGSEREHVAAVARSVANAVGRNRDLDGIWGGRFETTYVWQHNGVWLRCRPDAISPDSRVILSLKTTGMSAEPDDYARTLTNAGTEVQAAFELAAVEAETKIRPRYLWAVVEVEPPYACSILGLSPVMEDFGVRRMTAAVNRWRDCLTRNVWPSYPAEHAAFIEPPSYALTQWEEREGMFRPWREQPEFLKEVAAS